MTVEAQMAAWSPGQVPSGQGVAMATVPAALDGQLSAAGNAPSAPRHEKFAAAIHFRVLVTFR